MVRIDAQGLIVERLRAAMVSTATDGLPIEMRSTSSRKPVLLSG